jgi:DNA-binding MarR family transcriptional regulator
MSATDGAPRPGPADDEPPWLSDQERDTWLEVSTLVLQLPGLLDAQLQRDADLGLFDYLVLSWLSMSPDRRIRMGQLAQLARGSMSRLSNVVKRLEQRGFVERAPDPTNGRYTIASLTDAGWDKVVCAAPGHVRAVRHYVLDPLTPAQVSALQDISGRIAERIRDGASGDSPVPPS